MLNQFVKISVCAILQYFIPQFIIYNLLVPHFIESEHILAFVQVQEFVLELLNDWRRVFLPRICTCMRPDLEHRQHGVDAAQFVVQQFLFEHVRVQCVQPGTRTPVLNLHDALLVDSDPLLHTAVNVEYHFELVVVVQIV